MNRDEEFPSVEHFIETLKDYKISYVIIEDYARINLRLQKIYINPMFNEDIPSLCHELFHHYYRDYPEEIIEEQSQKYYNLYKDSLEESINEHFRIQKYIERRNKKN